MLLNFHLAAWGSGGPPCSAFPRGGMLVMEVMPGDESMSLSLSNMRLAIATQVQSQKRAAPGLANTQRSVELRPFSARPSHTTVLPCDSQPPQFRWATPSTVNNAAARSRQVSGKHSSSATSALVRLLPPSSDGNEFLFRTDDRAAVRLRETRVGLNSRNLQKLKLGCKC
jgi:hypothetical protein